MPATIRISKEVDRYIQKHGRFGETHDDVLRRCLKEFDSSVQPKQTKPKQTKPKQTKPKRRGLITSQKRFKPLIIKILTVAQDYELPSKSVIDQVDQLITLKPRDREELESGEIRWRNAVAWARNQLVDEGIICPVEESGRGKWRLTEKGVLCGRYLLLKAEEKASKSS